MLFNSKQAKQYYRYKEASKSPLGKCQATQKGLWELSLGALDSTGAKDRNLLFHISAGHQEDNIHYTTTIIEGLHRQFQKVQRQRPRSPMMMLYVIYLAPDSFNLHKNHSDP